MMKSNSEYTFIFPETTKNNTLSDDAELEPTLTGSPSSGMLLNNDSNGS